jgi:hypothetical protein
MPRQTSFSSAFLFSILNLSSTSKTTGTRRYSPPLSQAHFLSTKCVQVMTHCPTASLFIIGTDHDQQLQDGPGMPLRLASGEALTSEQGQMVADELKTSAIGFVDYSTITGQSEPSSSN